LISKFLGDASHTAGDTSRIYAYLSASVGGLVAGLVRSSPHLSEQDYSYYALWGVCALFAALFFSVISTKDYRSRVERLFGCGATALALFFVGVALQTFLGSEMPAPTGWPLTGEKNPYLLPAVIFLWLFSGIAIRRLEKAGFPAWLEVPSFAVVVTVAIILFFFIRQIY
jgi:hypothetical protein